MRSSERPHFGAAIHVYVIQSLHNDAGVKSNLVWVIANLLVQTVCLECFQKRVHIVSEVAFHIVFKHLVTRELFYKMGISWLLSYRMLPYFLSDFWLLLRHSFCANLGRQIYPSKNEENGIIKSNFLQEWLTQCLDCGNDFNPAVLGKLSELLLSLKWLPRGTFNELRKNKKKYFFDVFLPSRALFGSSQNKHT